MTPSRRTRIALVTAVLALGTPAMEAAAQAPGEIAAWAPEYTVQLLLPDADGDVSLAADADGLWLATETAVVRFADGVWSAPTWPADVSRIFGLASAGGVLWAVGLEGDAWRLADGRWSARPAPTGADLYAAAALGPLDAWAAGYDYEARVGVLVHWDGDGPQLVNHPALVGRRLVALVADPAGGLWAGGCAPTEPTSDPVLLHRAPGSGTWESLPLPASAGCIHHLAFAAPDRGLAAAGSDLLAWDGAAWRAEGVAPPADQDGAPLEWVRAAHVEVGFGSDGPRDARWAVAGQSTWRGYQNGQPPWFSEGGAWGPATVDDLGLATVRQADDPDAAAQMERRAFLDLASDGRHIWSVDGLPQELPAGYLLTTLFELADGFATLAHPLLREITDVAVLPDGAVWVAGREGTRPIVRAPGGEWSAMPGFRLANDAARSGLDVATAHAAWLWRPSSGTGDNATTTDAWRWDGTAWHAAPAQQPLLQLRARADGGAWARVGRGQRLLDNDGVGEAWTSLAAAPLPSSAMPDCGALQRDGRLCEMLAAPFDTAMAGGRAMGWLGGDDESLYVWDGQTFTATGESRGRVVDLQLLDERSGWAIAFDPDAGGARPREPRGELLRLDGRMWREVSLLPALGPRGQAAEDVVWHLMAPVSATEVWLYGQLTTVGRTWPVVVRWNAGAGSQPGREGRGVTMLWNCRISAMAAAPATDGGGSDLWLSGHLARGQDTCQLLGGRGVNRAQSLWPSPFPFLDTGPLSRLQLRAVMDRAFLPAARSGF